jgi:hypothetical protein
VPHAVALAPDYDAALEGCAPKSAHVLWHALHAENPDLWTPCRTITITDAQYQRIKADRPILIGIVVPKRRYLSPSSRRAGAQAFDYYGRGELSGIARLDPKWLDAAQVANLRLVANNYFRTPTPFVDRAGRRARCPASKRPAGRRSRSVARSHAPPESSESDDPPGEPAVPRVHVTYRRTRR